MNVDGSNQRSISNSSSTDDRSPYFSPDGKFIVYASRPANTQSDKNELWTMKIDGTDKKRITNNNYNDGTPKWSPK